MAPIDRDDWGNGERSSFSEEPAKHVAPSKSLDLAGDWGDGRTQYSTENLPVESRKLDEMRAWPNAPSAEPMASEGDLIANITPREAEAAAFTMEQIAQENPDLYEFEDELAELSDGTRAAIGRAIAKKPNARRGELLKAIADQFTLAQAVEFKNWHGNLPPELRQMLLSWASD